MRALLGLLLAAAPASAAIEGDRLGADLGFSAVQGLHLAPFTARPRAAQEPPKPPSVCSGLDFSGVSWPPSFGLDDQLALELALNISGSYEGADGWANLTGNFDGQGVSFGLLNQNLGQGSLQPMLILMRDRHMDLLQRIFTPDHLRSLLGMLAAWEGLSAPATPRSRLDEPPAGSIESAREDAGVAWARRTLYAGEHFDPVWKSEFIALANTPDYVTIQIDEAVSLHERAIRYERRAGVRQLRAYLMMFDVVVQNGSVYDEDFSDYDAWLAKNPKAGSAARLEKLLNLRLRHVRRRYVVDVHSRKQAIIYGHGRVHGEDRNLTQQYCYDGTWVYK